jgi:hypothetical protein
LKECENETKPWRFDAAVAIWRISGGGPEAIAVFEHGLHAADLKSRQLAVARLSEIGAEFPKVLTLLTSGLQDPALQIRVEVLALLAALGTNSIPVLPAIEAITNDRMFRMRDAATQAIHAIQPPIPKK